VATGFVTVASAVGLLFPAWWVSDLLTQPRPHYLLALLALTPFLLRQYRKWGALVLAPMLLNLAMLLPEIQPQAKPPRLAEKLFTVAHVNVDRESDGHERTFAYLRSLSIDLISLQEVTPEFADSLADRLPEYDPVIVHPLTNSHGSALLIRRSAPISELTASIIHLPANSPRPLIEASFICHGHRLSFLNLHATRPYGAEQFAFQSLEFEATSCWSLEKQKADVAVVILGDFNATPWSPRLQALRQRGDLEKAAPKFGYIPTWPATLPWSFGLPIDLCLTSKDIYACEARGGPRIESDHRPIVLSFAYAG